MGVLEDCLATQVERSDAIDLRETPIVLIEGLGLCPATRQDAPDGVEELLFGAIGGGVLGIVCLFIRARGRHVGFLFCQIIIADKRRAPMTLRCEEEHRAPVQSSWGRLDLKAGHGGDLCAVAY